MIASVNQRSCTDLCGMIPTEGLAQTPSWEARNDKYQGEQKNSIQEKMRNQYSSLWALLASTTWSGQSDGE